MKEKKSTTDKISRPPTGVGAKENKNTKIVKDCFTAGQNETQKQKKYQNRDWQDENE